MSTPSLEILATLIAAVINLILAVFIFLNNPKSATNRFFSFLATTIAVYLITNYFSLYQESVESTYLLVRVVMSIAVFINLSFFLLSRTYPRQELQLEGKKFWGAVLVTLIIALLAQTQLIFTGVEISSGVIHPSPGLGMPLFLIHTVFFLGGGFLFLLKKFRKSLGSERVQLKMLFSGAILMFSLILLTNVIFVLVFNVSGFVGLLPLYTLVFTGFVSYAIVKHGLFNLKVIATQAFTVVIWVILFSKIFVSESSSDLIVDLFIFITMFIFGILLVRSVVNEVRQREKLEELTQKLKEMDKQKDEFISMAAHELRAPMSAIKGYITMVLEGDTGDIPEKSRGFLADANNINERLIRLVNNMLNVSKIEEGRIVYQVESENLSQVVRTVFSQFAPEAERKGLKFTQVIPREIRDKVEVDPDRIHEVVANLLSNAVKYTEKGSVEVKLSQSSQSSVRLEVIDTGPGITKEEQKLLFKKFSRAESSVGKTTGTGLGLYISKLLVEKFKGKIGADSEPGKGSDFWFELPLASAS